ncbi:MAG: TRC40/GET3/ArsA family transport-energizing ATPase [Bacteroidales bacterium]|nr:TRC40/GET3/ArsA family transport-energizing ATPase [Bacteroidales bacterium]
MRIILFTGKGGVGKTTIAAATAIDAAKNGLKTLVMSTDPAHSLSDALNIPLEPEAKKIKENLWAQELDLYYSMQKYWGNLRSLMLTIFRWQGMDKVLAEELSAIPGMEEGSAFMWIEKYYQENFFDLIVIDSAPTGETLTLLTLPQVTKWWVTKAFPFQNIAIKTIGKGVRKTTGIPLDKGYDELQNLFKKLEKINEIFSDENITSIRIVVNPERMVINESKRAYTYLQLYGYNIDAIIINRILPETLKNDFFAQYIKSQREYLEDIESSFSPVPIFKVNHLGQEIFGLELLQNIATQIYSEHKSSAILFKDKPYKISDIKNGYKIEIKLSFASNENIKINKFGDELVIKLDNRRQNIFLPRFAHFMKLKNYSLNSGYLIIELAKE